jgi:murein DD-endopeptidase MepM/ murein hydrolase activator NlpD
MSIRNLTESIIRFVREADEIPPAQPEDIVAQAKKDDAAFGEDTGKLADAPEKSAEDKEDADQREDAESEDKQDAEKEVAEKEYLGSKGTDSFYYLFRKTGDAGQLEDLQVLDAADEVLMSAKELSMPIEDVRGFVLEAINKLEMSMVAYEIVMEYIFPEEEDKFAAEEESDELTQAKDKEDKNRVPGVGTAGSAIGQTSNGEVPSKPTMTKPSYESVSEGVFVGSIVRVIDNQASPPLHVATGEVISKKGKDVKIKITEPTKYSMKVGQVAVYSIGDYEKYSFENVAESVSEELSPEDTKKGFRLVKATGKKAKEMQHVVPAWMSKLEDDKEYEFMQRVTPFGTFWLDAKEVTESVSEAKCETCGHPLSPENKSTTPGICKLCAEDEKNESRKVAHIHFRKVGETIEGVSTFLYVTGKGVGEWAKNNSERFGFDVEDPTEYGVTIVGIDEMVDPAPLYAALDEEGFVYEKVEESDIIHFDLPHGDSNETIKKMGNKWRVVSHKGRNLGTYGSRKEAEKRLRQVEFFKHQSEAMDAGWLDRDKKRREIQDKYREDQKAAGKPYNLLDLLDLWKAAGLEEAKEEDWDAKLKRLKQEAYDYFSSVKISPTPEEIVDYVCDVIEDDSGAEVDQEQYLAIAKKLGMTVESYEKQPADAKAAQKVYRQSKKKKYEAVNFKLTLKYNPTAKTFYVENMRGGTSPELSKEAMAQSLRNINAVAGNHMDAEKLLDSPESIGSGSTIYCEPALYAKEWPRKKNESADPEWDEIAAISKKHGFGTVAWQDAMIARIRRKLEAGEQLSAMDIDFIEVQKMHMERLTKEAQAEVAEIERMWHASESAILNKKDLEKVFEAEVSESWIKDFDEEHHSAVAVWGSPELWKKMENLSNQGNELSIVYQEDEHNGRKTWLDQYKEKIADAKKDGWKVLEEVEAEGDYWEAVMYKKSGVKESDESDLIGKDWKVGDYIDQLGTVTEITPSIVRFKKDDGTTSTIGRKPFPPHLAYHFGEIKKSKGKLHKVDMEKMFATGDVGEGVSEAKWESGTEDTGVKYITNGKWTIYQPSSIEQYHKDYNEGEFDDELKKGNTHFVQIEKLNKEGDASDESEIEFFKNIQDAKAFFEKKKKELEVVDYARKDQTYGEGTEKWRGQTVHAYKGGFRYGRCVVSPQVDAAARKCLRAKEFGHEVRVKGSNGFGWDAVIYEWDNDRYGIMFETFEDHKGTGVQNITFSISGKGNMRQDTTHSQKELESALLTDGEISNILRKYDWEPLFKSKKGIGESKDSTASPEECAVCGKKFAKGEERPVYDVCRTCWDELDKESEKAQGD